MNSNTLRFAGHAGEIRWAYHKAADLSAWEIGPDTNGLKLTATVTNMDAFRVSQRPLTFHVPRPSGTPWVWGITSLQISGSSLSAELQE